MKIKESKNQELVRRYKELNSEIKALFGNVLLQELEIDYKKQNRFMLINEFKGKVFKFPKNNKIECYQDFSYYPSKIPDNIPFILNKVITDIRVSITSPGYGDDPYGHGPIFVNFDDILPYLRA